MLPRLARFLVVCALCVVALAGAARPGLQTRNSRPELSSSWSPPDSLPPEPEPVTPPTTEAPVMDKQIPTVIGTKANDGYSDAELMRVAACEQPGSGPGGVNWTHRGPVYEGGPGFWYGTWDAVREPEWADNAGGASIPEQLEAMRRVLIRWPSAWGTCRSRVGVR